MIDLSLWVASAIGHRAQFDAGFGQASLARMMSIILGRFVDRSVINKIIHGARDLSAEEMLCISHVTGFPIPSARPSFRASIRIADGRPVLPMCVRRWSAPRVVERAFN